MTRVAILVTQGARVLAPGYATDRARVLVADRVANGEAFPEECVVRLPRRVSRAVLNDGRLSWGFIGRALRGRA